MSVLASLLLAGSGLVACPATVSDIQSVKPVSGWDVEINTAKRKLEYIEIFAGPPSRRQSLQPRAIGRSFVWHTGNVEVWVQCHYRDSAAVLFRNIGSVKSCRMTKPAPFTGDPATAFCDR